jgi:hypothetical protein
MTQSSIIVQVDDRIRLMAALLSMTTWPFQEQDRQPHDVHAHAKATRLYLKDAEEHPAVLTMQELMEAGRSLDELFCYGTCLTWPNVRARGTDAPEWAPREWSAQIRDFTYSTRIRDLWERDKAAWDAAEEQVRRALSGGDPSAFLARFFGPTDVELVFQPNLAFPTDRALVLQRPDEVICVCPPRIAWGHNPPWPFDDDPANTYADAMLKYAAVFLREYLARHPRETAAIQSAKLPVPNTFRARHPEWLDRFAVLFTNGLAAIFLEETFGEKEAASFVLMAHKEHGFEVLESVVDVLRRFLEGHKQGKYEEFADYMPVFPRTLNIAVSMRNV